MAAPDNQSMSEMTTENEPLAMEEESNTNQRESENSPVVNEEASNTRGTELENHSVTNELALENLATNNFTSSGSGLGLLSLPSELRVNVYRHLLLGHRPLSTYLPDEDYQPFPAIINTSELIRQEAFQVMYGENIFYIGFRHPRDSILSNRQISDTIRNVHFEAYLDARYLAASAIRLNFDEVIQEFGSPAIIRGTLNIIFHVGGHHNSLQQWFIERLPRLTNFRIIRIRFVADCVRVDRPRAEQLCIMLRRMQCLALSPVFGPARLSSDNDGFVLLFHPQVYLNSLPAQEDPDWHDYLDGFRLGWNQNPTNADDPEAAAQNSNS